MAVYWIYGLSLYHGTLLANGALNASLCPLLCSEASCLLLSPPPSCLVSVLQTTRRILGHPTLSLTVPCPPCYKALPLQLSVHLVIIHPPKCPMSAASWLHTTLLTARLPKVSLLSPRPFFHLPVVRSFLASQRPMVTKRPPCHIILLAAWKIQTTRAFSVVGAIVAFKTPWPLAVPPASRRLPGHQAKY